MGRGSAVPDSETFVPYFSIGSLALYTACYVVLMSIGAGLAIPGGLFMPSIVVRFALLSNFHLPENRIEFLQHALNSFHLECTV
jgi:hypothetical protein